MGTPEFAAPIFKALLDADDVFNVVGLVSQPDRPAGRGRKLAPTPTKSVALDYDVPVFQPTKVKTEATRELLASVQPDVAVVAAYGRILPPQLLHLPRHGCVNVHASLLPKHRGASPINHAILAGDTETGVCLMQMDEGLDTGPVYARKRIAIAADDTTSTLSNKLAGLGAEVVVESLPAVLRGELEAIPQPEGDASYAPLLKKEDGWLDFSRPARALERAVRAYQPWPVASFAIDGARVQVGQARIDDRSGPVGEVLEAGKRGVLVGCGSGSLWLLEVKPPGKRMMDAAAWVAGRGVSVGATLT